jgi:hypothetical protein
LKTDYDENIYTTAIDKSHPQYKERLAAADRKAREIERSVPTTAHVAEERVMDFVGGDDQRDEEDKYGTSIWLIGTLLTPSQVQRRTPAGFPAFDGPGEQVHASGPARPDGPGHRQGRSGRSRHYFIAAQGPRPEAAEPEARRCQKPKHNRETCRAQAEHSRS